MSEVRKRVALLQTPLRCNRLVTAGKRNWLKGKESNLFRIVERETNDRSNLIIVDAVNQRGHQDNLDSRLVQIVYGPQLNVKKVPHLTMTVRVVTDAVKLKVHITQAGLGRLAAEV